MSRILAGVSSALVAFGAAAGIVTPAPAAAAEVRCPAPPGFDAFRVPVPIDRTGTVPGSIELCVQRRPSTGTREGALFLLDGGPGGSATVGFNGSAHRRRIVQSVFGGALASRDLVVFDHRGTGASGVLPKCKGIQRDTRRLGPCSRRLGPTRHFYTTREFADDIEAVRLELGVEKIALYGLSDGTRVAVAYAMKYPERVERMVLDSVILPEGPDVWERPYIAAMPRVFESACADDCASFTTDPTADLAELIDKIGSGYLYGPYVGAEGRHTRGVLRRRGIYELVQDGDHHPRIRGELAAAVTAALDGDMTPILRLNYARPVAFPKPPKPDPRDAPSWSTELYVAAICEERAWPWARSTKSRAERIEQAEAFAAGLPESDFYPFDVATALNSAELNYCIEWTQGEEPKALPPDPLQSIPTLMINGEYDLRSTIENMQTLAERIPGARTLTVAAGHHVVVGADNTLPQRACAEAAVRAFFADQPTPEHCDGPRPVVPRPPPPRKLGAVEPAPGVEGRPGRVLQAVALALDDAFRAATIGDPRGHRVQVRAGGLRDGVLLALVKPGSNGRGRIHQILLRDWVYVPGVSIESALEGRRAGLAGALEVSGTVSGTLRLAADGTLAGKLGGERVSMQISSP